MKRLICIFVLCAGLTNLKLPEFPSFNKQNLEISDDEIKTELDRIHSLQHSRLQADFLGGKFSHSDLPQLLNVFFYQVLNEMFFYNVNDCAFYVYHFADSLFQSGNRVFSEEKSLLVGTQYLLTAVHISPIAFQSCYKVFQSYTDSTRALTLITFASAQESLVTYLLNVLFNASDIFVEWETVKKAANQNNWALLGSYAAKIFSDVLIKNAWVNPSWNFRNSEIIKPILQQTRLGAASQSGVAIHKAREASLNKASQCLDRMTPQDLKAQEFASLLKVNLEAFDKMTIRDERNAFDESLETLILNYC